MSSAISIVITAAYIIRIISRVFFGKSLPSSRVICTMSRVLDKVAVVVLCVVMIVVGVYPAIMVPLVQSGVDNILRLLGGA